MRHILRSSILVVAGVLNLAQAGDHIYENAPERRGLSDTLAELGLSGAGIVAVEQPAAEHHGMKAEDYSKEPEKEQKKGQTKTVQTKHTVTIVATVPGETKTKQRPGQNEDGGKGKTKTVQMTVTVEGPPPVANYGTCAVVTKHITSTMVELLTLTIGAPAPPVAAVTQTVLQMQPATTLTVQVTHTVTSSPSQVAGKPEPQAPVLVTNAPSAAAPPMAAASSLVVGGAGQVASGTGTIMANGACGCMCLCSSGSFPTIEAMPQPPAQPATTLATSIVPQPTSVASDLVIDTSSPPPAPGPSSAGPSSADPSRADPSSAGPSSADASTVSSPTASPAISTETSSTTSATSLTSATLGTASPTPESSPSSAQSSISSETASSTSSVTAETGVLPSPLAATQAFSLQLTIAAGAQPTGAPGDAPVLAPIDIKTFSLTSALILGSLAKPTVV